MLHQNRCSGKKMSMAVQLMSKGLLLMKPEDLLHVLLQLRKGIGFFLILSAVHQREAEGVKMRDIAAHEAGQDMDAQVYGGPAAPGLMDLMAVDQVDLSREGTYGPVGKIAGRSALHKEQKLHRLMPVSWGLALGMILIYNSKAGVVQIR